MNRIYFVTCVLACCLLAYANHTGWALADSFFDSLPGGRTHSGAYGGGFHAK